MLMKQNNQLHNKIKNNKLNNMFQLINNKFKLMMIKQNYQLHKYLTIKHNYKPQKKTKVNQINKQNNIPQLINSKFR